MSNDFPLPHTEAINDISVSLAEQNNISLDEAIITITNAVLRWGASVAKTMESIDWRAFSDAINAIETRRSQRKPAVSRAQVRRAIKHLPNTLWMLK